MKKTFVYLISLILIIFQISVTPHFKFFNLNFGFVLASIIVVSSIFDTKTALVNAILCGIIFDGFVSLNYGVFLLLFIFVTLITLSVSQFMYKGSLLTSVIITFVLTILTELILYYIYGVSKGMGYHSFALTRIIIPQAFINAFVSIIVFGIYKWLFNKMKLNSQW